MKHIKTLCIAALSLSSLIACERATTPSGEAGSQPVPHAAKAPFGAQQQPRPQSQTEPHAAEAPSGAQSQSGPPAMDPPGPLDAAFTGEVVERLPAGSYCYLQVQTDNGRSHWVATVGKGHPIGTAVRVKSMGVREAFRSRRLERTFERLLFGIVRLNS